MVFHLYLTGWVTHRKPSRHYPLKDLSRSRAKRRGLRFFSPNDTRNWDSYTLCGFLLRTMKRELAFSKLPVDRRLDVHYDDFPGVLPKILEFIGIPTAGKWENHQSSLQLASDSLSYMSEVTSEFVNKDVMKRARLKGLTVGVLAASMSLTRPLRPFLGPIRNHFDHESLKLIRERALQRLKADK